MSNYLTVSDVVRELGIRPRDVSDLFYQRRLDDAECPVIGGRRLIPSSYVPFIRATLQASREAPEDAQVDRS